MKGVFSITKNSFLFLCCVFIFADSFSQNKPCTNALTNGGFELPVQAFCFCNESTVPDWNTTETTGLIELWPSGFQGVPAYQGNQFAEINANVDSSLYINICTPCATTMTWEFAHRGRSGVDACALRMGPPGGPYTIVGTFSDGNTAWGFHTGTYAVPTGQTITRMDFKAI